MLLYTQHTKHGFHEQFKCRTVIENDLSHHNFFSTDTNDQDSFEVLLPLAVFENITINNAIDRNLDAVTICAWLQRNRSAIEIKYSTKLGCEQTLALGIHVWTTIVVNILGNEW